MAVCQQKSPARVQQAREVNLLTSLNRQNQQKAAELNCQLRDFYMQELAGYKGEALEAGQDIGSY